MLRVLRYEDNEKYWDRRWTEAGADADEFRDLSIYPIRFAEMVATDPSARMLEVGAGLGRVLKHYHRRGLQVVGVERSAVAVNRLLAEDPSIQIRQADVCDMPFDDGEFDLVLAFGVYHNLETGLDKALAETSRCLRPGGHFCISMRPHNMEMLINERYWRWKRRGQTGPPRFHKWLVKPGEFRTMLASHRLDTRAVHRARNVSLLYRVRLLRAASVSEAQRRSAGYRLNWLGRALDGVLTTLAPSQFCNVLVFIGEKR